MDSCFFYHKTSSELHNDGTADEQFIYWAKKDRETQTSNPK